MRSAILGIALACALTAAVGANGDFQPAETMMLLDEKAHKAAVKASYQSNVKTIYFHLEEIIRKILAHKTKWTNKYNGDLANIAKGLIKHKNNVKDKMKKYIAAKGKKGAANKLAALKGKSWNKAKAKLKAKKKDAAKEKKALKGLYVKGLKQKEGEICMIRKIQCMVAKFNGEKGLQKKYCGVCKEKSPSSKVTTSGLSYKKVFDGECVGSLELKMYEGKTGDNQGSLKQKLQRCAKACISKRKPIGRSWPQGYTATGFVMIPSNGRCFCEKDNSMKCKRRMNVYSRYDFGSKPKIKYIGSLTNPKKHPYVYQSRGAALAACKDSGYKRLCSKQQGEGFQRCAAGWYSNYKGYWMGKTAKGCGSGKGFRGWGNGKVGAYCCVPK